MKKKAVIILSALLLPVCCSVLCGWNRTVLALTDNELAYLDNLTSGGADSAADYENNYGPSPAYDDPWYLSRLRRFPSLYYDPYYAYYYPYSYPYPGTYGYPWRYYDEDHHDHDWYKHHGRTSSDLTDSLEKMLERRQNRWENFQSFMLDRREERRERFENIRDKIQDMFSRERSFGVRDNRRDDFGSRFPCREQRGMSSRGPEAGNLFRGGRR